MGISVLSLSYWIAFAHGLVWILSLEQGSVAVAALPPGCLRIRRRRRLDGRRLILSVSMPLFGLLLGILLHVAIEPLASSTWCQQLLGMSEEEMLSLADYAAPAAMAVASLSFLIFFFVPRRATRIGSRDGRLSFEFWHARRHTRQLDGILRGMRYAPSGGLALRRRQHHRRGAANHLLARSAGRPP
ncbi:MAG: hypothetical protein JXR94_14245 [Candidatus Hydrogenedentes bacterium]|nr:hypothetical protein [Candidatus Hydrogenedentota bacterium]